MYSLIVTAKMNHIDPQAWLADGLARIAEHPVHRLDDLLPWNWRDRRATLLSTNPLRKSTSCKRSLNSRGIKPLKSPKRYEDSPRKTLTNARF
jgi:hypothetical protein